MTYTVVVNGVTERTHVTLKKATKQFDTLKTKPETKWMTIVKQVRKDNEVVAYYELPLFIPHRNITAS